MRRCYDPRRMSSARARNLASLGRAVRGIVWTALFAVLAAGAAGLIAQASHPPGTPARAELTAASDTVLNARLDQATAQLQAISDDVDALAADAKAALEDLSGTDPTKVQDRLEQGSETAQRIDAAATALEASLQGLPGTEPDAALRYSQDTLVRRATVLAALDAAASLNTEWLQVTTQAAEVSQLMALIAGHDQAVLDAAAKGRKAQYAKAVELLGDAVLAVANVKTERQKLITDPGPTVLDEWIDRNGTYDLALRALYQALVESKGNPQTAKVQAARRAERLAFEQLPPDRRTIIVIVGEAARGGLTQAVVAIEDARGRIEDALGEGAIAPGASTPPEATGAPPQSPGAGGSTEPAATPQAVESGVPLP
jgi:hypothetical protein